jgi:hypothetical protein
VSSPDWDAVPPRAEPPYGGPPQQQWGPPAEQGVPPYQAPPYGQPQYPQPHYGQPQYGQSPYPPPWGPPPYGYPPPGWGPHPVQGPQRPGSVIAAAVVAFSSTLLVLVGTVYAMAFSALLSLARGPDAGIGPAVALLQLALAGLLVTGGLRVLGHDRWWLLGAAAGQLAMTLYWLVVLDDVAPSTIDGSVLTLPLVYGALAVVAAGLTFLPDARAWTTRTPRTARDDGA